MKVVAAPGAPRCDDRPVAIRQPILIDGTGAPPRQVAAVIVADGRIRQILEQGENLPPLAGLQMIDAEGAYLIPGLWDMHIHLFHARPNALPLLLAYGVTSARDMGGDLDESLSWREALLRGDLIGPRLFVAGPMLESPAAIERARERGVPESILRTHWPVASVTEAAAIVDRLTRAGVDFIKGRSYASPEILRAIADASARNGLAFGGHPLWSLDPMDAVEAGQSDFEHGFYPWPPDSMTEEQRSRLTAAMVAKRVVLVPTLVAWEPRAVPLEEVRAVVEDESGLLDRRRRFLSQRLLANWRKGLEDRAREGREGIEGWRRTLDAHAEDIGKFHRGGVTILPGTDLAGPLVFPGSSLHEELALFVEKAGLTPMDALVAATAEPARFMGVADRVGMIEEGKEADLVLLALDPLEDIRNLRSVKTVVRAGCVWDRGALSRLLDHVQDEAAAE